MTNFIPDTDKTITLPVGIDFREPGQPSPYRDRSEDAVREQQRASMNLMALGNAGSLSAQLQRQAMNEIFGRFNK